MDVNGRQGSYPSHRHYLLQSDDQRQVCECTHEVQQLWDVETYWDPRNQQNIMIEKLS